jgi:hypothetical protein
VSRSPIVSIVELVILAALHVGLADVAFPELPYSTPPAAWLGRFPSQSIGAFASIQLLNVIGSLAIAVPIALLFVWRFPDRRLRSACLVAVPTALSVLFGYPCCDAPGRNWTMALWVNDATLSGALVLSVPLLVGLARLARPTIGWSAHER